MKVHLVDGTFELFRGYYGARSRKGPSGREVGATRSLARSMISLLNNGATHIGIAFDTVIESFRNELFDGYKTGAGIEANLLEQFELAERATRALGIVTWSMIDFEADDAIATAAARAEALDSVEQVIICTPDKDLAQCIRDERVIMWDRIRDIRRGLEGVREKFGVEPASIPDYLALVGDTADGIPGIPGWGAKSSATLLAAYGTVEEIPDDPDAWKVVVRGAARLGEALASRRDDVCLYKRLATLRMDVPLKESIDDLEWRQADSEALAAISEELGDPGLRSALRSSDHS